MQLGNRLAECRNKLKWTQLQVAAAMKVPRELVSMWENDNRRPNIRQLEDLAQLFNTSTNYLLGKEMLTSEQSRPKILLRGLDNASPEVKAEIDHWAQFLDDWSAVLEDSQSQGRAMPPKSLDHGPDFSDTRSASKLAIDVRSHYGLGLYGLPDLYAFLDEQSVLVCQAKLGSIGDGKEGISGAFYNHDKLGYCILVNAQTSKGRQMFTLAHEFAHALFHYGAHECIISRQGEGSSREQFADAFAAHFLIPSKGLRKVIEETDCTSRLDEYGALILAHYFNVSFAFMLNRLLFEKHISETQKQCWKKYSPRSLARHIGLDSGVFQPRSDAEPYISKYPSSVLKQVRDLIEDDRLSVGQAADLLRLDPITIQSELLQAPAEADVDEQQEAIEFEHTHGSSRL